MEKITHIVKVLGRTYRLKIDQDQITQTDAWADEINTKVKEFQQNMDGDLQDFLSMACLYFISKQQNQSQDPLLLQLAELEKIIDGI